MKKFLDSRKPYWVIAALEVAVAVGCFAVGLTTYAIGALCMCAWALSKTYIGE
jgi:hypothetical protein